MTAQTQTEVQAGNESSSFTITPKSPPKVQPTAKGFAIPKIPTFNTVEEKRRHVKERLACAFRYP